MAFRSKALIVLGTLAGVLAAVPAAAQINAGQAFGLSGGHAYRNNVAFDPINQVYLVIVQRPPVTGRFYDRNGTQISGDIVISSEGGFNAWASVAFGGHAGDPAFLVTYVSAQGNNPKFGRLVRFNGGSPWVTGPSFIVDVGTEWTYAEKAQNVWTGNQFIVGSRVKNAGASFPTFQVNHFDLNGGVSGGVDLGDGADYYGAPAIACVPGSTCLAIGYMAGIPTGYTGGSYGRLFHGPSLGPQSGLFHLSAGMANEDQGVVYQAHLGRFLAQWFRGNGPGFIDTRIVNTDGSMSALDLSRGIGPDAGTNAAAYNAQTRSTLLLTKLTGATLWAIELGDDGYPRDPNNWLTQTMWDGQVLDYLPSIAANSVDGQWLVTWELQTAGYARIIRSGAGGQKAQLTSPAPGSTLSSSAATFQWNAGSGATQYWLFVGTSPGASDVVSRDMGTGRSTTVTNLPTNGQTLYVRLHTYIGSWQYNDYTLTAVTQFVGQKAELTSPAAGSTLPGSTATFQWNAGSGVTQYWLFVGTSPGASDIVSRDMGTGVSTVVNGLPTNGQTLYVRLHSYIGAWQFNDYTLTAATQFSGQKAQLISPEPGSFLASTTLNFQWTGGAGATQYWLFIGTAPGTSNILSRDAGTNLSTVVSGLPANGQVLYVRLHSYIGGWQYNDYTLTAPLINGLKAQLISPAPGSTLSSTTVTFQWTGGTGATQYWLFIGTAPGTFDILFRNLNTSLSTVVSGLPSGGQPLYVRLHSFVNGAWQFNDYVLTATGGG